MPGVDVIKATLDELFEALSAQLIGEPMELEDQIIIPIMKMGLGLCTNIGPTGLGASREDQERRTVGGGVGLFPVAVVIVSKGISGPEGVKVATLSPPVDSISGIAHVFMDKNMRKKSG